MLVLTARPDVYIFPPRSQSVIPRNDTDLFADLGWMAQPKVNDSHLLLKLKPDAIEFWTRHGDRMSYSCPDWLAQQIRTAQDILGLDRNQYHLLDGGLLDSRHAAIKDTIVLWDILVRDGEHLVGSTYQSRYGPLYEAAAKNNHGGYTMPGGDRTVGALLQDNLFIPHSYASGWDDLWQHVDMVNLPYPQPLLEGIIYKDPNGLLEHGFRKKNNGSWMVRSRVTTRRHRF